MFGKQRAAMLVATVTIGSVISSGAGVASGSGVTRIPDVLRPAALVKSHMGSASNIFALVLAEGGLTDHGYGQSTHLGMTEGVATYGGKLSTIESQQPSDYVSDLQTAAGASALTVAAGVQWQTPIGEVAKMMPSKEFTGIDVSYTPVLKNVQADQFESQQGSYLAGIVAVAASKDQTIGFVGGEDVPVLAAFLAGYEAGALSYDPNVKIKVAWVGNFTDEASGKQDALAEYAAGADVVYQAAGGAGLGVITAAKQVHKLMIGVDTDQNYLAPQEVLTSVVKRVDVAAEDNVKEIDNGTWKPGNVYFTLANGGVGLAPYHSLAADVPAAANTAVAAAKAGIISGKITVPMVPKYPTGRG